MGPRVCARDKSTRGHMPVPESATDVSSSLAPSLPTPRGRVERIHREPVRDFHTSANAPGMAERGTSCSSSIATSPPLRSVVSPTRDCRNLKERYVKRSSSPPAVFTSLLFSTPRSSSCTCTASLFRGVPSSETFPFRSCSIVFDRQTRARFRGIFARSIPARAECMKLELGVDVSTCCQ